MRPHNAAGDHAERDKKDQDRCWALLFVRAVFDPGFRADVLNNGSAAQRAALPLCGLDQTQHGGIQVFTTAAQASAAQQTGGGAGLYRYLPDFLPRGNDRWGNSNQVYVIDFNAVRAIRQQYGMNTGAF